MNNDYRYQSVTITLSNGKKGTFTGKVLVDKEDEGMVKVLQVDFFEPQDLPAGAYFEEINKNGY